MRRNSVQGGVAVASLRSQGLSLPRATAVRILDAYRRWVSPLLPAACRFTPTCSEYARLAFERYGFWSASWRTLRRLLRCHPFHPGGLDLP